MSSTNPYLTPHNVVEEENIPIFPVPDEQSSLLQRPTGLMDQPGRPFDYYHQFCNLVGVTPYTLPPDEPHQTNPSSLYQRALQRRRNQSFIYALTATLANCLLLVEVILGATITALGASDSSRILITVFGALNTVIAGLIAVLRSGGLPLRARTFYDDLDYVVNEIESSAVMWLGISRRAHGYSEIDTDELVTIRSEVARLTGLYDSAIRANSTNDPGLHAAGAAAGLRYEALRAEIGQAVMPTHNPTNDYAHGR